MRPAISTTLRAVAAAAFLSLAACGGGGGGGGGDTPPPTPTTAKLSAVTLVDASKAPLSGAEVTIGASQTSSKLTGALVGVVTSPYTTDANGNITLPEGLPPGIYVATIKKGGASSQVNIKVDAENDADSVKVMAPLTSSDGGNTYTNIASTTIIASISGKVSDYGTKAAIAGAEISLSGGQATNGAVAVAQTDSNGLYTLLINVNKTLAGAMLNATVKISAEGYESFETIGYQVLDGNATTGLNYALIAATTPPAEVLWQESFEGATANDWSTDYYGDSANNGWHIHTAGENITNQALYDPVSQTGYVLLAPDDTSNGAIPDPAGGTQCFWYGNASTADGLVAQGNYLDVFDIAYATTLDGGTSGTLYTPSYENYDFLYSPTIDLTAVDPTTPVSLTFKTWWEVESTNPNVDGYDRMTVEYSIDGGTSFIPLARLNPISDPQDALDRSPIPFSNTGYNSAPSWIQQEAIPLDGVQGQTIQLRFYFDTWDDQYNGFRGWLIDDVMVQAKQGTFPTLDPTSGNFVSPTASSYVFGNYDATTYEQLVLPASIDASGLPVPLNAGSSTAFSAGVTYVDVGDTTTIGLAFWGTDATGNYTQLGSSFALVSTIANTEQVLTLSGTAVVPQSADGYLDLWVEMYDGSGGLVADYPLEYYSVQ